MTATLPQLDRPQTRSVGRGCIDFELVIRALNDINYAGHLSVEWEEGAMNREAGTPESCAFVKRLDFKPSANRASVKRANKKEP